MFYSSVSSLKVPHLKAVRLLAALSDTPQRLRRPQEQLTVRHCDGAQTIVVHIVLREHFEFRTLLDHRRQTVFAGDVELAVGERRRGAVRGRLDSLWMRMKSELG